MAATASCPLTGFDGSKLLSGSVFMTPAATLDGTERFHNQQQLDAHIAGLQEQMRGAAANLDFEKAASLRDQIKRLRNPELGLPWPARRA